MFVSILNHLAVDRFAMPLLLSFFFFFVSVLLLLLLLLFFFFFYFFSFFFFTSSPHPAPLSETYNSAQIAT